MAPSVFRASRRPRSSAFRSMRRPTALPRSFGLPMSSAYYKIFLFYVILLLCMLTAYVTIRLRRMPVGRAWEALREDEIACRSLGINTINDQADGLCHRRDVRRLRGLVLRGPPGLRLAGILRLPGIGRSSSPSWFSAAWARLTVSRSPRSSMIGGTELLREMDFLKHIFGENFTPELYRMLIFGLPWSSSCCSSRAASSAPRTDGVPERTQERVRQLHQGGPWLMGPGTNDNNEQETHLKVEHLSMKFGGLMAINDSDLRGQARRHHRADRPERRRQDHGLQLHHRLLQADDGHDHASTEERQAIPAGALPDFTSPAHAKVARTFQNIRLFSGLTVLENLLVAQHNKLMKASGLYRSRPARHRHLLQREAARRSRLARFWLEKADLIDRADDPAGDLPYGAQRRLEIARAMCTGPELLCLDEPAAGLNPRESARL